MTYSKTFAFLIVAFLGWIGIANVATNEEVSTVIDSIMTIVGILGAFWGRYKKGDVSVLGFKR